MSTLGGGMPFARSGIQGPPSPLTRARLAWIQATHRRAWAVGLGICLAIATTVPALLPVIDSLAVGSGVAQVINTDGNFGVEQKVASVEEFGSFGREVDRHASNRLGGVLVRLTAYASAEPLHVVTLNADPAPAAVAGPALTPSYFDELSGHVDVVAGVLPPDGLAGGETAVTMSQAGADQAGLHLNDRLCLSADPAAADGPRWCARLVGLWQPVNARDPFWGGSVPRLQLTMGRYDFFQFAKLQPQPPLAGLRYWPDPQQVDSQRAGLIAGQVTQLASELRTPQRQVRTRLDASLLRVMEQHRAISSNLYLLAGSVALLGLAALTLVAGRVLEEQSHELAVLRARGWPAGRVWRLALVGLAAPALYGLPALLIACLLVAGALSLGALGATPRPLGPEQLRGALAIGSLSTVAVLATLALLAATAVWRDVDPSLEGPFRRPLLRRRLSRVAIVLAVLGTTALFLPRLSSLPEQARAGRALIPALGLFLLSMAAVRLWPVHLWLRRRSSVAGILAGWQLERFPQQHAAAALVLTLASGSGVFAALTLAWERGDQRGSAQPALWAGLETGLSAGFVAILALVLTALALHYASTARLRLREYAGLFAHGMTAAEVARSLASEQAATAASSLVLGLVLGAALAVATLPLPAPSARVAELALFSTAGVVISILAGSLAVGSLARRMAKS